MKVEQVKISELKEVEYNPRRMTEKQVKDLTESIRKFGLVDPIIVNSYKGRENVVVGGHQRLKIARQEGFKAMPVVYVLLDEKDERELNLRLNRNLGEWDWDLLADFNEELLKDVGFEEDELMMNFGLSESERSIDELDRMDVLQVLPPESSYLKDRCLIEFSNFDNYKKVKEAVKSGLLDENKILEIL